MHSRQLFNVHINKLESTRRVHTSADDFYVYFWQECFKKIPGITIRIHGSGSRELVFEKWPLEVSEKQLL